MIHVLYHANCFDGVTAAAVCYLEFGEEAQYHPMYYKQPLPFEAAPGGEVILVDYSRPLADYCAWIGQGVKLTVIDHHPTAFEDLDILTEKFGDKVTVVTNRDNTKAGGWLTWEYFNGNQDVPLMVYHTSQRDVWDFEDPDTKPMHLYLLGQEKTPQHFARLIKEIEDEPGALDNALRCGFAVLRVETNQIEEMCKQAWMQKVGEYEVPCANVSVLFSEVPHRLLELYPDAPFAMYMYRRRDCYQYGLRGRGDFDVSRVAKEFGGGGHKSAAGFECRYQLPTGGDT